MASSEKIYQWEVHLGLRIFQICCENCGLEDFLTQPGPLSSSYDIITSYSPRIKKRSCRRGFLLIVHNLNYKFNFSVGSWLTDCMTLIELQWCRYIKGTKKRESRNHLSSESPKRISNFNLVYTYNKRFNNYKKSVWG